MKVKVGQWVRTSCGSISFAYDIDATDVYVDEYDRIGTCHRKMDIVAVADTPQELIQVGDLVQVMSLDNIIKRLFEVIGFCLDGTIFTNGKDQFGVDYGNLNPNDVTAIFTPNADETQYTLQWKQGD